MSLKYDEVCKIIRPVIYDFLCPALFLYLSVPLREKYLETLNCTKVTERSLMDHQFYI
jgi:hypothetical protein